MMVVTKLSAAMRLRRRLFRRQQSGRSRLLLAWSMSLKMAGCLVPRVHIIHRPAPPGPLPAETSTLWIGIVASASLQCRLPPGAHTAATVVAPSFLFFVSCRLPTAALFNLLSQSFIERVAGRGDMSARLREGEKKSGRCCR